MMVTRQIEHARTSFGSVTRGHELSCSISSAPPSSTRATCSSASSFGDFFRNDMVAYGASAETSVSTTDLQTAQFASWYTVNCSPLENCLALDATAAVRTATPERSQPHAAARGTARKAHIAVISSLTTPAFSVSVSEPRERRSPLPVRVQE
eukprot:COSAG02_NODE_1_length_108762_cov_456.708287_79_plen_152_part_00